MRDHSITIPDWKYSSIRSTIFLPCLNWEKKRMFGKMTLNITFTYFSNMHRLKSIDLAILLMLSDGLRTYRLHPRQTSKPPIQKGTRSNIRTFIRGKGSSSGALRIMVHLFHCYFSQVHTDPKWYCYIIKEWFFLFQSFFLNYILSFTLVGLWTIRVKSSGA